MDDESQTAPAGYPSHPDPPAPAQAPGGPAKIPSTAASPASTPALNIEATEKTPAEDDWIKRLESRVLELEGQARTRADELEKLSSLAAKLQKQMGADRENVTAAARSLLEASRQLESRVEELDLLSIQGILPRVFVAKIVAWDGTAGTYKWTEQTVDGSGTLVDYASGRGCDDFTHASAATEINGWKNIPADRLVLMLETPDLAANRYHILVALPAPADATKDYVVAYDGTGKDLTLVEVTDEVECPDA